LLAPEDHDVLSAEDAAAIEEARGEFDRGETVSWESYLAGRRVSS
jgi:hypothetical protein